MNFIFLTIFGCASSNITDVVVDEKEIFQDSDNDGFSSDEDCDDSQPTVFPGATEICDGIDNDCSGEIDDGVKGIYYPDEDGDGFGDNNNPTEFCSPQSGYTQMGSDCNDNDPTIYPSATEICDGVDNNCDGAIDEAVIQGLFLDSDGDGYGDINIPAENCTNIEQYVPNQLDCDDSNPNINYEAEEICDEIDNDCDGAVDEAGSGIERWYEDSDGDGFGNIAISQFACSQPEGFVGNDEDCNDESETQFPQATEVCNSADDDCNGIIDDNAIDPITFYFDLDGDGFGSAEITAVGCVAPTGYVESDGDCNDMSSNISPIGIEYCNEIDDDCNGVIDDNAFGTIPFYADLDEDGYGDPEVVIYACEESDNISANSSDCDDSNSDINPQSTEFCNNLDDNCDGNIDEYAFDATIWYADFDGDTYGDLNTWIFNCSQPPNYVDNLNDCDDNSGETNEEAEEICDEIDNDCDGAIDEAGSGIERWYEDSDGDGFGNIAISQFACSQPEGFVGNDEDCNDESETQFPQATEICNSADDDCNGNIDDNAIDPITFYLDVDNDGFGLTDQSVESCTSPVGHVENDGDCDDTSSAISPIATEICNEIDDDCNDQIDDNAAGRLAYFPDNDGDGFGDPEQVTYSCDILEDLLTNDQDCDDTNPSINPLGTEVCNGQDDNCNEIIDDYSSDASYWYRDVDEDGFGDVGSWSLSCNQPNGYVSNYDDCDDNDTQKNPNTIEICNDLDDNCNNQIDEGIDKPKWYTDEDGDGFGNPWTIVSRCTQPDGKISNGEDCDDFDPEINPNADEICNDSTDNNCDSLVDDPSSIDAFEGYLDVDEDGYFGGDLLRSCDDIYHPDKDDCDDDDAMVNPDIEEECDGIDNDCDGDIDAAELCPCEFEQYEDSSYLFCLDMRSWFIAKGECENTGYHLITVNDVDEDEWLDDMIDSYSTSRWWAGFNDLTVENYWDWDGPFATYTNWGPNEPNNWNGDEDCALLNQWNDGTWNDANCDTNAYYVCEANP